MGVTVAKATCRGSVAGQPDRHGSRQAGRAESASAARGGQASPSTLRIFGRHSADADLLADVSRQTSSTVEVSFGQAEFLGKLHRGRTFPAAFRSRGGRQADA